jgi:phage tail-like protein
MNFFKRLINKIMQIHPLPAYHFLVEWGGARISFIEVSGLEIINDVIEHHDGSDPGQVTHKMPGLRKYSNIVLKRGIVEGDNDFFNWMNTQSLNEIERRDIVVKLLNQNHEPVISWRAINAFPVRLSGPVLNAAASNVAIEELELAHEGLTVQVS